MGLLEVSILSFEEFHAPAISSSAALILYLFYNLKDFLDVRHCELLEECVEGGGAGTPILSFTKSCIVFLHTVLFFVDSLLDSLSPFINSDLEFFDEFLVFLDVGLVLIRGDQRHSDRYRAICLLQ